MFGLVQKMKHKMPDAIPLCNLVYDKPVSHECFKIIVVFAFTVGWFYELLVDPFYCTILLSSHCILWQPRAICIRYTCTYYTFWQRAGAFSLAMHSYNRHPLPWYISSSFFFRSFTVFSCSFFCFLLDVLFCSVLVDAVSYAVEGLPVLGMQLAGSVGPSLFAVGAVPNCLCTFAAALCNFRKKLLQHFTISFVKPKSRDNETLRQRQVRGSVLVLTSGMFLFVFSSFLFVMQLFMAHSVQPSTCMTCTPNPHLLVWNFPVLLKSYKIYIETLWTPWIPFACPPVKIYTKILTVHQLQNW